MLGTIIQNFGAWRVDLYISSTISICGTGGIFSEQSTRLTIRNLLDRRFGTIFLYNNDSFMISILLHRQNLNLVILDERNYLKDFVL